MESGIVEGRVTYWKRVCQLVILPLRSKSTFIKRRLTCREGRNKGEDGHLQAKERLREPSQGVNPAHTLDCSLPSPKLKPSISDYLTLSGAWFQQPQ